MFIKDRLVTSIRALSGSFFNKGGTMPINKNKGSTYFRVGTQKQQILARYWGTGKTFTLEGLTDKLDAMSPGARVHEIREAGFNVKATADNSGYVGRPAVVYSIPRRRVTA